MERYARSLQMGPHQVVVGLERALWEAGPNPITDFADTLEFEGKPIMPPQKKNQWEALGTFRDALTQYLEGKVATFIGGVAVRSYGGRTGATLDYDVLIEPSLLQDATSFLEKHGALFTNSIEDTYLFHVQPCAIDLDLRVARSALDREALKTAKPATFSGRKLKIVRADFLAAMKVKAYSERKDVSSKGKTDRLDVRGLMDCGATTKAEVTEILRRHRPDLLPELDAILK